MSTFGEMIATSILVRRGMSEPQPNNANFDHGICRHCDRAIFRPRTVADPHWWHWCGGDSSFVRGCRAATYTPGTGWNDLIDRRSMAAPHLARS
jgi:hypothetical protein